MASGQEWSGGGPGRPPPHEEDREGRAGHSDSLAIHGDAACAGVLSSGEDGEPGFG